jgi:hypothetical protein
MLRETKMGKQASTSHKRTVLRVLLLPVMAILWIIGWSLYWIGSRKQPAKTRKEDSSEQLAFMVQMPEQKQAT